MQDVPKDVRARLSKGEIETVNLMEWLAADMSQLAATVAKEVTHPPLRRAIAGAGRAVRGHTILGRLKEFGLAIASSNLDYSEPHFRQLSTHRSDLVRQWACYAVNVPRLQVGVGDYFERTLTFAADSNMTVREAAWMAFRPHLQLSMIEGLGLLTGLASSPNENLRRFAVEVSRPRSVWGAHLDDLKRNPDLARGLLDRVKGDGSRYVQLAVGNWLNDASKTRPDWVMGVTSDWLSAGDLNTRKIVKRGLRTLRRDVGGRGDLFPAAIPSALQEMWGRV